MACTQTMGTTRAVTGLLRLAALLVGDKEEEGLVARALTQLAVAYPGTTWVLLEQAPGARMRAHVHGRVARSNVESLAAGAGMSGPVDLDTDQEAMFSFGLDPIWSAWPSDSDECRLALAAWTDPGSQEPREAELATAIHLIACALLGARELAELRTQNTLDALTGVLNRRATMDVVARERQRAQRHGHPVSVLFVDVDAFKQINDRFGHATGDRALVVLADTLTRAVRASDAVGRVGGDEFLIVLPHTDLEAAGHLAGRIESMVAATPVTTDSVTLPLRVTIGASSTSELRDADIIDLADRRMLHQKTTPSRSAQVSQPHPGWRRVGT